MSRYEMPYAINTQPTFNGNYMYNRPPIYIEQPQNISFFYFPLTPKANNYLLRPELETQTYSRIVIANGRVQ